MQIDKSNINEINNLKKLWLDCFDKDTESFCDFAFTLCDINNIYTVKIDEKIVSMLMAIDVTIANDKGFYIYSACTDKDYRKNGYMQSLIEFAYQDRISNGDKFAILKPAANELFDYYKKLGFVIETKIRTFDVDIKANLWANAEFDIVTASRFGSIRSEMCEIDVVDFSKKGYEKFTEYVYTCGGSSVTTKNAYAVYFIENNSAIVRELFAKSNNDAINLIQAIRERTGVEKARISLDESSLLFLGEGKLQPYCLIKGLDKEVYANLMFD